MVSNATARKISHLVRPLGYAAAPELITVPGFDIPLLALTNQSTREVSVAVRLQVSIDRNRRWTEAHAYTIRDLIDYADRIRRQARIIISGSLKEGSAADVLVARDALVEAIAAVTEAKAKNAEAEERQRWKSEAEDLLNS